MTKAVICSLPTSPASNHSDDPRCLSCQSTALRVDWAQGDRICTNCGLVAEESVVDDRPEWRDPAVARCSLVAVDEMMYFGGLQPTNLSARAYGAPTRTSISTRKRLISANRRSHRTMEKMHAKAIENTKLSLKIREKGTGETLEDDSLRPEIDQMLQMEEEGANRLHTILYSGKWSLQRAVRIFGSETDMATLSAHLEDDDDALDNVDQKLDQTLRKASQDLFNAYSTMIQSAHKLQLPERVVNETSCLLSKYAAIRDGIRVRGVASQLARNQNNQKNAKEARAVLREYNAAKQSGALCIALIFFTSRKLGSPRTLSDILSAVSSVQQSFLTETDGPLVKKKHCTKAMAEVKEVFPDLARAIAAITPPSESTKSSDAANVISLCEHITSKLRLPPVADACVRSLVVYWLHHNEIQGKIATVCGAMTVFVCSAGQIMQKLASQAAVISIKRKLNGVNSRDSKRLKIKEEGVSTDPGHNQAEEMDAINERDFDVFDSKITSTVSVEQRAYEMRRVWDAWSEQQSWTRSLVDIEHACGVAKQKLVQYFEQSVFPVRKILLSILRDSVMGKETSADSRPDYNFLKTTPLASVLLPQIGVATELLKVGVR
jgi:transcription initiation factor TFIIIB Brf1 subunit/transcription initiation factor TFIIB